MSLPKLNIASYPDRIRDLWKQHSVIEEFYDPYLDFDSYVECGVIGKGANKIVYKLCENLDHPEDYKYVYATGSGSNLAHSLMYHLKILQCYLIDKANGFNLPFRIPHVYRSRSGNQYIMDAIPGDLKSQRSLAKHFRFDYYEDMVIFHTWVRERCKIDPIDCEYYSDGHQIWVTDFGECRPFAGDTEKTVRDMIEYERTVSQHPRDFERPEGYDDFYG